jgi:hypothetical protein
MIVSAVKIIIISASLMVVACSQPRTADMQERSEESASFNAYLDALPKIPLPYEVYCEKCCEHPGLNADIKNYLPEGATLVGLIFRNEKHAGLLVTYAGDMLIPAVVVFDLNGNKVDEETFMTQWCGLDLANDFAGLQYFRINNDLTLNETDTIYTFARDRASKEIRDTVKSEIETRDFYINSEGKIVERNR